MEDQNVNQPTLFQNAIRWGLIMGGVSIALTAILYAVDYTILANWKFGIGILVLLVAVIIYAGIDFRKQSGGTLAYGKAFQHAFITLAISGIVSTAFMILLYTVIDTDLPQKLVDTSIEQTRAMMEGFGMPEDKLDEAMEDARKRSEGQFSAMGALSGYGFSLIFYAIVAAITSFVVRKNPPDEMI